MSGEIAFANTALESFAALVTFVLLFACIAKIKMQRGIKHVTLKEAKRNTCLLYTSSRNANVGNVKYSYIYGKAWFVISPKTHFGFVKE